MLQTLLKAGLPRRLEGEDNGGMAMPRAARQLFGRAKQVVGSAARFVAEAAADPATEAGHWLGDTVTGIGVQVVTLPGELPEGQKVPLGGNPVQYVNRCLFLVVAVVGTLALILGLASALGWDGLEDKPRVAEGGRRRPSIGVWVMLAVSYLLLLPGIFSTLFGFNLVVEVFGKRVGVIKDHDEKPQAMVESTASLIKLLYETGSLLGAFLVALYAIVVPIAKLVLLALAEWWRKSSDEAHIATSRRCVILVQFVSKWASPDMFAYVLLLYLFRALDCPGLTTAVAHLDVGFVCLCIFCVLSTSVSHAIPLPGKSSPTGTAVDARTLQSLSTALLIAFLAFLGVGVSLPCLSLGLDPTVLKEQVHIPALLKPVVGPAVDRLVEKLEDKVHAEVSLWQCSMALGNWSLSERDFSCLLALVMVLGFAVLLPLLDMLLLYQVAHALSPSASRLPFVEAAMEASNLIKHTAMLDVCIMGVVVVCFAGSVYRKEGVVLALGLGIVFLLLAEIVHYVAHWLVSSAAAVALEQRLRQPKAL